MQIKLLNPCKEPLRKLREDVKYKLNTIKNITKAEALNKKITVIHTKAEQFELNPYEQKPLHIVAAEQKEKYGKCLKRRK